MKEESIDNGYTILVEGRSLSFAFGGKFQCERPDYDSIVTSLAQNLDDDMDDIMNWHTLAEHRAAKTAKRRVIKVDKQQANRDVNGYVCGHARAAVVDKDRKEGGRHHHISFIKVHPSSASEGNKRPRKPLFPKGSRKLMKLQQKAKVEESKPPLVPLIDCGEETHCTTNSGNRSACWRDPEKKSEGWRLTKNRNRRITRFLTLLCSIKGFGPHLFVSLNIPRPWYDAMSTGEVLDCYKRFIHKLKYHYREASMWGIWKLEYSPKSQIHMHLYFKLSNRYAILSSEQVKAAKCTIRNLFYKTTKIKKKKSVNVKEFDEKHYSYLSKPAKAACEAHLISIIGRRQLFNVINDRYIPVYKDIVFSLTEAEFPYFAEYIINNTIARRLNAESIKKQFSHKNGHISFIPRKTIAEAILYARKKCVSYS